MNSETKNCRNCKQNFVIEPDDFGFYEKIGVPAPTLCPDCRYIRRLLDRNEYNFCKRKCDATQESIISIYRPDAPFPVYKQDYWRSDAWDAMEYGRDLDFNRPFFDQYEELRRLVPHLALVNSRSVNSEYTNQSQDNKDCYMLVTSGSNEKCMYGSWNQFKCFLCSDCYMIEQCELCYECINLKKCSKCVWIYDCSDCVEVYFSNDCRGCINCFGCVGLRKKQYCWFNTQLEKQDYERKLKEFPWSRDAIKDMQSELMKLRLSIPVKHYHGVQIQNSSGDYLENSQRAKVAFNCRDNKDTAYMQDAWQQMGDCRDCTEVIIGELSYEIQGVEAPNRTIVARSCFNTITDSCYCDMCFGVRNCFGCFGLKSKEYCILNKQYSKEEYTKTKERIIAHMRKTGEWGEYFPPSVSPFAYNESMAQDYFPLSKDEALRRGYKWHDGEDSRNYIPTMEQEALPQKIADTADSMEGEVIRCASQLSDKEKADHPGCTTAFRIMPLEIGLYRKLGIPVPAKCFPCRRTDRFKLRNPRKLWHRKCQCSGAKNENGVYANTVKHQHGDGHCPNEFETSYAPERKEIVYCESCYNAEVV
ncbi:MAG: hypothetical protein ABSF47_01545 [Minisyncoccia bacterium]|jgi:hypothetical protein